VTAARGNTRERSTRTAAGDADPAEPGRRSRSRLRGPAWLDGPMTSSHLVLGSAGLLLVIGLIMVFSA
jgi:cell division protein FtsW